MGCWNQSVNSIQHVGEREGGSGRQSERDRWRERGTEREVEREEDRAVKGAELRSSVRLGRMS